ncbi:subtilisin-like serine protease [Deinococcus koreensis]|uniref:Subtilisin-like serine protease n=2 Tax=Deinococcus koreensis TaxID=2054903 RepID=A0A2K3V2C7_9DEIO|nr:subtilisin-like serine protease [Deinococcus koreensis]
MHAMKTPNDTFYPVQWGAQAMNLPAAWDITTGSAVTVAVVDSGIVAHPDLAGRLLPGFDFVQDAANAGDGNGADADPTDEGGDSGYHGAHVAGIVAAASNNGRGIAGVSWGARIVPVRVLGKSGGGPMSDILLGIYWAAGGELKGVPVNPNPARVINLSLGGAGECSAAEQELFDALAEAGIVTVVAAGNENSDTSTSSPANCRNVIAVGALGPDGKRAYYSNHGARIDLMAPGGNTDLLLKIGSEQFPAGILSTVKDDQSGEFVYAFYQGTSQATPQVAGLAALLLGKEPGLSPAQVLARMKAAARPVSDASCGVKSGCGAGLIDAAATLKGSATPTPTPAPVPAPVAQIKTLVAAFYVLQQGFDLARSPATLLEPRTLRNPYQLKNAQPGKYLVGAWQDINSNGEVDEGEPLGAYPDFVTVDSVARTIIGIDITLEPYRASATATRAATAQTPLQSLAQAIQERAPTR